MQCNEAQVKMMANVLAGNAQLDICCSASKGMSKSDRRAEVSKPPRC